MKMAQSLSLVLLLFIAGPANAMNNVQSDGSCPVAIFIPFHDDRTSPDGYYGYGSWSSEEALGKAGFSLMATALMAKDHFNQRDTSVVPALKDYESCTVSFPDSWFLDSRYSRSNVVNDLLRILLEADKPDESICAVIGPSDPRANEGASVVTENLHIPQIAYETIDRRLERKVDFPTFIRGIPAATDIAPTIAEFIQRDFWHRDFVGVIYDQSDYGEQFEDPLEDYEDDLEYVTITEHVIPGDPDSKADSLGEAKEKGFHTIVFAGDKTYLLPEVAEAAVDLDGETLVGEEYVWFFTGDIAPPELFNTMRYEVDSPMDKILRGAALITNYDPFIYNPQGDAFLNEWKSQNDTMLERLRAMHPVSPEDPAYYGGESGYFQDEIPSQHASFLYDAIMNAGMAACRSVESNTDHIDEVVASDFEGASGRTVFYEDSHSRDPVGVSFGIYNVRPGPIDESSNTRGYTRHLVATYNGTEKKWVPVEGEKFIFFDGTSDEPSPVRDTVEWNYLSKGVQTLGFALIGATLFIILISMVWVFVRRKERIVTASQPEFLYLLCFGAGIQAVSLICISFDESFGWTENELSLACSLLPWFFVIGYLVQYCAIFSKLWRLSKLLSMRRRAVQFSQVMLPFTWIITASVAVLIAWQMIDPLQWNRNLLVEYLEEDPWESYGQCAVSKEIGTLPYIIPLVLLFLITMLMTLSISWKMRTVQSDLSEARWIFIAVFSHIQIWLVGIPVFLIVNEISRDASYLISMALIFVFSNVFVVLVIWPKMIEDIRKNVLGLKGTGDKRSRISVDGGSTRVSGLQHPSAGFSGVSTTTQSYGTHSQALSVAERSKIQKLQAELTELKAQLATNDSFVDAECQPAEITDGKDCAKDSKPLGDDEASDGSPNSTRVDAAGQLHSSVTNP